MPTKEKKEPPVTNNGVQVAFALFAPFILGALFGFALKLGGVTWFFEQDTRLILASIGVFLVVLIAFWYFLENLSKRTSHAIMYVPWLAFIVTLGLIYFYIPIPMVK